jgi:hypothetical protein
LRVENPSHQLLFALNPQLSTLNHFHLPGMFPGGQAAGNNGFFFATACNIFIGRASNQA